MTPMLYYSFLAVFVCKNMIFLFTFQRRVKSLGKGVLSQCNTTILTYQPPFLFICRWLFPITFPARIGGRFGVISGGTRDQERWAFVTPVPMRPAAIWHTIFLFYLVRVTHSPYLVFGQVYTYSTFASTQSSFYSMFVLYRASAQSDAFNPLSSACHVLFSQTEENSGYCRWLFLCCAKAVDIDGVRIMGINPNPSLEESHA